MDAKQSEMAHYNAEQAANLSDLVVEVYRKTRYRFCGKTNPDWRDYNSSVVVSAPTAALKPLESGVVK